MYDSLVVKETWIHKINPSLKLILLTVIFLTVLFIHNPNVMINLAIVLYAVFFFMTGHPKKRILLFSIPFFLIFISTASTMIMFGKGSNVLFEWALVKVSEESLFRGIHIGFRALVFASLSLLFALTTRPVMLFYSLMQQLKVSPKYAYAFMAALRLLPILFDELQTLRYALKVRGAESGKGLTSFYLRLKRYTIPLFSQSIRRAHRIAVAMEAKRFSAAKNRTYYYITGFSRVDLYFITLMILIIISTYYIGLQFPYFQVIDVRH
ncbi:ABC transporter permease [Lottiidibacillus patelloidae]|uniref:ABC transporter permease n=1 Tax=Lottiidibacillus patelloidae TaxID=2670334 RepID=A0A263BW90_9BACI|nr:energy-coupling factor transporter transmembrane component T [Lottiidibacillus patelloidae]OZM57456.1 ABC transporter permease [Lottiidibacillus patelloidae]